MGHYCYSSLRYFLFHRDPAMNNYKFNDTYVRVFLYWQTTRLLVGISRFYKTERKELF